MDSQRTGDCSLSDAVSKKAGRLAQSEWTRLQAVFDKLADASPKQRQNYLRHIALASAVERRLAAMFAAHEKTGILDRAVDGPAARPRQSYRSHLCAGELVGGFRIDRLIGRGGMGDVYLAQRDNKDFHQFVALKLLRAKVSRRLELFNDERRTLAGLDHPGIARLVDGGLTPDNRPWMAMEYVEGQEIDKWCLDRKCDLKQRLELFLQICDAVSHANARLVIHRDIKPANILVDASGRARLLDFGPARSLDARRQKRTSNKAFITPNYASPEQLEGGSITVSTDIYGLGAVLFELLTGRGPWQMGQAATLPTILRRLLHEEPPAPSEVASGKIVTKAQITGDLDAIVSKALRRCPAERYESVASMAEDIRRHLAFRPVLARKTTLGYEIRRFVQRNKWTTAAAGVSAGALLFGISGIAWQARLTGIERDSAQNEAKRLEAVNSAVMLMFRDIGDDPQFDKVTVNEMVGAATSRAIAPGSHQSPEAAATVGALADLHLIVENYSAAHSLLANALVRGVGQNDPAGQARIKLKLGTVLVRERNFEKAQQLLNEAAAVWQTEPIRFRRELTETSGAQAYLLRLKGQRREAIALLTDTLVDAEQAYFAHNRDLVSRYSHLIRYLIENNQMDDAQAVVDRGLMVLGERGQRRSGVALTLQRIGGGIAWQKGNTDVAEKTLFQTSNQRRTFYGRSAELAIDLLHYGRLLVSKGKVTQGLKALDEAKSLAAESFGADSRPSLLIGLARANALASTSQLSDAKVTLADLEPGIRRLGSKSLDFASFLRIRAIIHRLEGNEAGCNADSIASQKILSGNSASRSIFDFNKKDILNCANTPARQVSVG